MAGTKKIVLVEQISRFLDDYKPIFRITANNNETGEHTHIYSVYFTQVYNVGIYLHVYYLILTHIYYCQKLGKLYSCIL